MWGVIKMLKKRYNVLGGLLGDYCFPPPKKNYPLKQYN